VLRGRLEDAIIGRRIERVRIGDATVIRSARAPAEALEGRRFETVKHRGRFLLFDLSGGTHLAVNPMLAGLFELVPSTAKLPMRTPLALTLESRTDLRYRDDKRMGKVYILEGTAPETALDELAAQGPEAGALPWGPEEFARRARARGGDVRNMLMDDRFLAGIGNAYADEVLHHAHLHPKRRVRALSDEELASLREAIQTVLAQAVIAVEAGLPPELGTKVRSHLRVRGRAGEPCPRCGAPVRVTRAGLSETFYCPACQPPPAGVLR
jgi:formamidopyrimidine-DNA glycosylase